MALKAAATGLGWRKRSKMPHPSKKFAGLSVSLS